ncbi:SMC-Scp complex subunit ScpB [Arcanobacterium haemolyticum]|uniref:SMC-Scp complex subunit ScpB n=1 Tax=Arcanobacterium haemolyticum TaxID=28264 RepID=UPI000D910775|nr:SMC-Scp complex subunit ScpB [Arcanobacterium haemolyticum]SPT74420.1 Segregation and condensation protein B [Arcanobacterium haemolyticum]
MNDDSYRRGALEAILMVAPEPVSADSLARVVGSTVADVTDLLTQMADNYSAGEYPHGFQLRNVGGGWRFYSHPRYADVVSEFMTAGQSSKLSVQALETLAVIAYRQPVSRAQIAAIRGVDVDSVVRTLQTRGLVQPAGVAPESGAVFYGTTDLFLEKMGMNSLDELDPLAPYLPDDDEFNDVVKEMA